MTKTDKQVRIKDKDKKVKVCGLCEHEMDVAKFTWLPSRNCYVAYCKWCMLKYKKYQKYAAKHGKALTVKRFKEIYIKPLLLTNRDSWTNTDIDFSILLDVIDSAE